jgi:protein-tyrosine phosphatase
VSVRSVTWGNLENAWDLGGLPVDSGLTRPGRVFRSMSPDRLDAAGWSDVLDAGIDTIVDLRNDYEVASVVARPASLAVIRCAIEDQDDDDFMSQWGERLGSPAYYPEILRRWPKLVAAAIAAVADAPGPVLFHCGAGRDRTGMISAILEQLVGVSRDAILDDYSAAVRAYNSWLRSNPGREKSMTDAEIDTHLESALPELEAFLDGHDFETYLIAAGVTPRQLAHLRSRLLD